MLILYVQILMDRIDIRFSLCPYRDIIGCTITTCAYYCPDAKETYEIYLEKEQIKLYWQKLKDYEKNYPFPQEVTTCPF